jgi:hypothetical protein
MADFDIDVIIDERTEATEKGADAQVDAHPWLAEARSLPSKIGAMVPPLSDTEKFAQNHPAFAEGLKQRTMFAQIDVIDRLASKMPKPADLATAVPPVPEPEPSFGDLLTVSNVYAQLNHGLHGPVIDKLEATLNQVARDPYPSPKLALLRELMPLAQSLDLKKPDGQPDYDGMMRLRLAAMRADDLLRSSREVLLERATAALEIEQYNLQAMRKTIEEYGDWNHPENMLARQVAKQPVRPMPSERRQEAEARRIKREQKALAATRGPLPPAV